MANQVSNRIAYLLATKAIDFASDVFKIILMQSGFTYDPDTHDDYGDVSGDELPNGNGYTTGGATLAGVTVTRDNTNNWTQVAWNNVNWTASGGVIGPACGAIIYDDTEAADAVLGFIDFGGDYTQQDGGVATGANIRFRLRV